MRHHIGNLISDSDSPRDSGQDSCPFGQFCHQTPLFVKKRFHPRLEKSGRGGRDGHLVSVFFRIPNRDGRTLHVLSLSFPFFFWGSSFLIIIIIIG